MQWKYVKPIKDENCIREFEELTGYELPDDFKECIMQNNGGRPDLRAFDTDKRKERELKSFLSFNKDDMETVWKISDWNKEELQGKYIPFAIDNFGNIICFDRINSNVWFLNLENSDIEKISNDFSDFLQKLYD